MASYLEAIREFQALTHQREESPLDARLEQRFKDLSAWIESGAGSDPPETLEMAPASEAEASGPHDSSPSAVFAEAEADEVVEVRVPTLRILKQPAAEPAVEPADLPEESAEPEPPSGWLASPEGADAEWDGPLLVATPDEALGLAPQMAAPEDDLPDEEVPAPEDDLPDEIDLPESPAVVRNPVAENWFDDGLWDGRVIAAADASASDDGLPPVAEEAHEEASPLDADEDFPSADEASGTPWLVPAAADEDPAAEQSIGSLLKNAPDLPEAGPALWSAPAKPIREAPETSAGGTPGPSLSLVMPPLAAPPPVVTGEHRVVLHMIEGQVKRGTAADVDLGAEFVSLRTSPGGSPEQIPFARTKALFFLLQPGERAPQGSGRRVQVAFADGRKVEGFMGEDIGPGFFLTPVDARTNTARVYVLHHAVRAVSP